MIGDLVGFPKMIQEEALNGRYLDQVRSKQYGECYIWKQMGLIEWIFRKFLHYCFPCIGSVEYTCAKRSWMEISDYNYPEDIRNNIENYFLESRNKNHPLNLFSSMITSIYMSFLSSGGRRGHCEFPVFQTHRKLRVFDQANVAQDVVDRVASVGPYALNFYDRDDNKTFESQGVLLFNALGNRIVVLNPSWQDKKWCQNEDELESIEVSTSDGTPLFKVAPEGEKDTFVFRELGTGQLFAVAKLSKMHLAIAVKNPAQLQNRKIDLIHLLFPLFYKMQMYFPNPRVLPYVDENSLRAHPDRLS